MNTNTTFDDITALEKELAEIAPFVRQGFEREGGPSPRTEAAILAEARRVLDGRRERLRRAFLPRAFAAAAVLALLLGGSIHLLVTRHAPRQPDAWAGSDENIVGFADLLLDIQGLNEEGFFRTEAAESLWL